MVQLLDVLWAPVELAGVENGSFTGIKFLT